MFTHVYSVDYCSSAPSNNATIYPTECGLGYSIAPYWSAVATHISTGNCFSLITVGHINKSLFLTD